MTEDTTPRPTDGELAILNVLWRRGPSTVKQVQAELGATRRTGYTTVLKLLQIMWEKGLVTRDESCRAHVYAAARTEEATQADIVSHLVDRVFSGSASALVLRALSDRPASEKEREEIRCLLDEMEGES